jgi:CubicO group peptidase (beta-lactamase class C family)
MKGVCADLSRTGLLAICLCAATVSAASDRALSRYQLPAGVAEYSDPYIAAGFRALFTCSAHFIMGRPLPDILAVELADTEALGLPEPVVDEARSLVRAGDGTGRLVTAVHRETMGCTVLPPDWTDAQIPFLPNIRVDRSAGDRDNLFPDLNPLQTSLDRSHRELLDTAFDAKTYGEKTLTTSVIIIRDGQVLAERYREGFGPTQGYRTWSTAKSMSATLIGIAAADGLLRIDAPVGLEAWSGPGDVRAEITWQDLLWMSSGLYSGGNNTYAVYFAGQDALSAASTTQLEEAPGLRWKYANNDTLLLLLGLREVLGSDLDYLRYPYDRLLQRIGMNHTWMETDHAGNFIGSSQVYTTARDLARFGLLYLQDGVWAGERILPSGWAAFVAEPAPAFQRQLERQGYGAQFWLYDGLHGLPPGTYSTSGNKGQHATIIPTRNMVVVRTGVDPLGHRFDQPRFAADAMRAFGEN